MKKHRIEFWLDDNAHYLALLLGVVCFLVAAAAFGNPIHVANDGDDRNPGTIDQPIRSVAEAKRRMAPGRSDVVLFKRGDRWGALGSVSGISGASADSPDIIGAYGDGPRPVFDSINKHNITHTKPSDPPLKHVIFRSLSLVASDRVNDPFNSARGVRILGNTENLIFEDMEISGFQEGLVIQKMGDYINDITLRRSYIHDNFSTKEHSQGLYASKVDGLLIEENFFDHNGWKPPVPPEVTPAIPPTKFNHGLYIQHGTTGLVARGNILSRNSSHGLQARNGGIVENNLMIDNAIGVLVSSDNIEGQPRAEQIVRDNVVIEGSLRKLDDGKTRGWGYDIFYTSLRTRVDGNLAVHADGGRAVKTPLPSSEADGIIVYNWGNQANTPAPSPGGGGWPDPNRTIESYHQALGRSDSTTAFLNGVISSYRDGWSDAYTADAVNDYIRAGFGLGDDVVVEPLPDIPVETEDPADPEPDINEQLAELRDYIVWLKQHQPAMDHHRNELSRRLDQLEALDR